MPLLLSIRFLVLAPLAGILCAGCREKRQPTAPEAGASAQPPRPNLAALGRTPDWAELDVYQNTITQADFSQQLEMVFAQPRAWTSTIFFEQGQAGVRTQSAVGNAPRWTLHFAPANAAKLSRYWRPAAELPPLTDPALPLEGLHVALDPGHIGGHWARVEERWFQLGTAPPVKEGELTLKTARILQPLLEKLGAKVSLVRNQLEPVTRLRPADFRDDARAELVKMGLDPDHLPERSPAAHTVDWQAEKLFYRTSEIRARAEVINDHLRPDFVVCLHFNAEGWGNAAQPVFSSANHLHLIINGGYSMQELTQDDSRAEMLMRLLQRCYDEEVAVCAQVAESLAAYTGLPAYTYSANALPLRQSPYLWARNLLANRLYRCPVIYCEPYVMNNQEVYDRIQAGDYDGEVTVAGKSRMSIFREYAHGVAEGLRAYYAATRH